MNEPPVIIGVETEYAVAPRNRADSTTESAADSPSSLSLGCPHALFSAGLISRLKTQVPHLCGLRSGLFLGNGARVYDDRGHPEYATPEASTPLEAAAHVLAGRRLLQEALLSFDGERPRGPAEAGYWGIPRDGLALFDLNLDYAEQGCAGWACHENYAFRGPARTVRQAIIPHLCSRIILTGAGGFNPHRPLAFVISPRAMMVPQSSERNQEDALFHVRQEPYAAGPIDRLHIISGESLRSHRGIFLKLGTTALLVWLAQRGHEIAAAFRPRDALSALKTFSQDVTGFARVCCAGGDWWSALEIQRALLAIAQNAIGTDSPGDWARSVLELWRESLNRYALQGQLGLEHSFDWAIKWAVFDADCRRFGISFQELLQWDEVLRRLGGISRLFNASLSHPKRACEIFSTGMKSSWRILQGRSRDQLEAVLQLRLRLRELDWRFCQVGDGVFDQLQRQGVLRHDVPGLTSQLISDAMKIAPRCTRASVRAEVIKRWQGCPNAKNARCDWRIISDPDNRRVLELNDPTSLEARWHTSNMPTETEEIPFDRAIDLHRASRFHEAGPLLSRLRRSVFWPAVDATALDTYPFRLLRYSAWVQSRLGRLDGIEYLRQAYGNHTRAESEYFKMGDELYCYRFLGLAPHAMFQGLVAPALRFLSRPAPAAEPLQANVREHLGAYALWRGWLDEVEEMIGNSRRETTTWRRARINCILADTFRRKGLPNQARVFLDWAREGLNERDVLTTEQILPIQAKLETDAGRRGILLDTAIRRLREHRHPMALARALLLRARNCGRGEIARGLRQSFRRAQRTTDVLGTCPLAVRIMRNWRKWTESFDPDEVGDVYWGL